MASQPTDPAAVGAVPEPTPAEPTDEQIERAVARLVMLGFDARQIGWGLGELVTEVLEAAGRAVVRADEPTPPCARCGLPSSEHIKVSAWCHFYDAAKPGEYVPTPEELARHAREFEAHCQGLDDARLVANGEMPFGFTPTTFGNVPPGVQFDMYRAGYDGRGFDPTPFASDAAALAGPDYGNVDSGEGEQIDSEDDAERFEFVKAPEDGYEW